MQRRFLLLGPALALGLAAFFACSDDASTPPPTDVPEGGTEASVAPDGARPCQLAGASMGPNAPNAADALDGGTGVPWQNPVEVLVSDGKFVTATLRPGESTQELLVRDFDFALLKDVNIVGIVVNIRRAASYTGVTDLSVRLAVGNNRSRSNRAVPNVRWPIFASNVEYGRPDDLWGEQGWVPAEVNDKSFGVAITARAEDNDGGAEGGVSGDPDSGTLAAQIDHVGITVFYEICR